MLQCPHFRSCGWRLNGYGLIDSGVRCGWKNNTWRGVVEE